VTRLDFPGLALAASRIRRADPFSDFHAKVAHLINRVTFHLPPRGVLPRWMDGPLETGIRNPSTMDEGRPQKKDLRCNY
jgi:hypothetical protein